MKQRLAWLMVAGLVALLGCQGGDSRTGAEETTQATADALGGQLVVLKLPNMT